MNYFERTTIHNFIKSDMLRPLLKPYTSFDWMTSRQRGVRYFKTVTTTYTRTFENLPNGRSISHRLHLLQNAAIERKRK